MKKYALMEDFGADGWALLYESDNLQELMSIRKQEGREKSCVIFMVIVDYDD